MEINIKQNNVAFTTLAMGDVFKSGHDYYIRCKNITYEDFPTNSANALNLKTGCFRYFTGDTSVELKNYNFTVED